MSRLLRERGLALAALLLAVVGLVAGAGGSHTAMAEVVVASRTVAPGAVIADGGVRMVSIDARDRTPGMATSANDVVGQVARIRLARGDYVLRAAVARAATSPALRAGERAVPLSIDPAEHRRSRCSERAPASMSSPSATRRAARPRGAS